MPALPAFWTREQRGEEASAWLIFDHKYPYLRETTAALGSTSTGAFCIPEDIVRSSPRHERILLFLAVALMESLGIHAQFTADPAYEAVEGFVVAPGKEAVIANWVRGDGMWHVDVTARSSVVREFTIAARDVNADSITAAPTPAGRLRALAHYLELPWSWLIERCGASGLVQSRSRLVSAAGIDAACVYVGSLPADHRSTPPPTHPRSDRDHGRRRPACRRVLAWRHHAMTAQTGGGATPTLSADDLVAAVPGLAGTGISVDVNNFRQVPGASLGFSDLLELSAAIQELSVDGVVITQGTDTIEETAFLLDLLTAGDMPVVVTGAMRNASMAGADGPAHVLAAVRVAASSEARGAGCVVVFGEEIHAARWVRRTHATSAHSFHLVSRADRLSRGRPCSDPGPTWLFPDDRSPGRHRSLRPHYRLHCRDRRRRDSSPGPRRPRRRSGRCRVWVGHVPMACVDALTDLAKRMPVILATSAGSGPVLRQTYGFPGSESDLIARGLISDSTLDPVKARILLHLLLITGADKDQIVQVFGALS
ncbi:asparaginase domain-containing protein [Streptomyces sp. NPDC002285]